MDGLKPAPSTYQDTTSDEESDNPIQENYNPILESRRSKRRRIMICNSDSSENNSKDNLETDSEEGELTSEEISTESVASDDDDSEYDDTDETMETGGCDEEWTCNGCFKKFVFEGKAGLNCSPDGPNPYDFFKLSFDNKFFSSIVVKTNKYGKRKNGDQWKKLTVEEFKIFLGLILHTGTIKCPYLHNYWNTQRLFNFKCFSQHMSRNRFQDILHCLYFSSNNKNNNRFNKIQPIIDYFNNKMKEIYYPQKELSINETIVPCGGRLALKQNIAGKKQKYGIKLYTVSERSGIDLQIKIYERSNDDAGRKEHATNIVLYLLNNFLQKGHSVYIYNYYSSYDLTKQLLDAKTYCTGTLRRLRKGNNVSVIQTRLAKGEMISRYKNNIVMGKFKDKRNVLFISSEFEADLLELENTRKGKYKKPFALYKYEEFMNSIDKKDQMSLSYYTCLRRKFKWSVKLWVHIVETLILNSFFLYSKYSSSTKKKNFHDFRLSIIDILLFDNNQKSISPTLPQYEHLPEILPRNENNKMKRKRCRQCFAKGIRKNTKYSCSGCKKKPGLCLGECFKDYHKDLL